MLRQTIMCIPTWRSIFKAVCLVSTSLCDGINRWIMHKFIVVSVLGLLLTGCASLFGIPPVVSYISTGISVGSTVTTGKSPTEHLLDGVTGKDCDFFRAIDDEVKVCLDEKEYIEWLVKMNCETYRWDQRGNPFCLESETRWRNLLRTLTPPTGTVNYQDPTGD